LLRALSQWDVGGQHKIRPLWRHYYTNTDALIYVVDAADSERLDEAKEELHRLLIDDELRNCPVLIFANKMDLPKALSVKDVAAGLGLDKLRNRAWHVQGTMAVKGEGLYEGLDWVSTQLKKKKSSS